MGNRGLKDIENDFANLCARAGHITYTISVMKDDLKLVHEQIKELNLEAASLKSQLAEEEKSKKAAESTPSLPVLAEGVVDVKN